MLEGIGLGSDAEAVYRVMLLHRKWGVLQIATELGRAESQIRDALDQLADLALLRQSRETPDELRPVHPEMGLRLLLERQHAQVIEHQQRFAKSQAAVSQLISEYSATRQNETSVHAERIEGMDSVQSRLEELASKTSSECLSFIPGGDRSLSSLAASRQIDELMLKRGKSVRTVYMDSARNDKATLAYARWFTQFGGAARTTPTLPIWMVLLDREVALVPLNPECTRHGAVQLTGTGIIAALVTLFEQVWTAAVPLDKESRHADAELTGQERELLRLLSQGLTDEVVARKLAISLRTERRMMAHMMERLGAHSRFEAGLRVNERRWLSPLSWRLGRVRNKPPSPGVWSNPHPECRRLRRHYHRRPAYHLAPAQNLAGSRATQGYVTRD
jgi:DNA-binding CsgD family transcriptional regulator